MWRDLVRSDVSCEIQLVSREHDDILAKHFAVFKLELHINRKQIAILLQTPTQSFSRMTTIQLCLLRLFHIASVSGS